MMEPGGFSPPGESRTMLFITDLLSQTWANLRANKLRTFLTMFGIVWGVISFLLLSALGEGFARGNQKVLAELGKNIVIIRNGRTSMQAGGARAGRVVRLTIDDLQGAPGRVETAR